MSEGLDPWQQRWMASTVIKKVSTLLLESKNRKPSNLETSIRKLPQDKLNGLFSHDMSKHIPKISNFLDVC